MGMRPYTREDYLSLWRSVLPKFYTAPIEQEAGGRGLDVPSSQAVVLARVEDAANITQQAYFLRPHSIQTGEIARGPRKASGVVLLSRSAPNLGAIVIDAGTRLEAEQLGTAGEIVSLGRYLTTETVTIPEGSGAPVPVAVEAEFQGYTGNLDFPGQIVRFEALGRAEVPSVIVSTVDGVTRVARAVAPGDAQRWDIYTREMVGRYVRVVQAGDVLVTPNVSSVPRRVVSVFEVAVPGGVEIGLASAPVLDAGDTGKMALVEVEELEDDELDVVESEPVDT